MSPSSDSATIPAPGGSLLGTRVLRTEDPRLLRGVATYIPDLPFDDLLHAVFVRSEVAHGTISSIDTAEAAAMPGVVAVWTADDLDIAPHHGFVKIHDDFARPPLARDRVRFVGEQVAVVFAETRQQAVDAAAAVVVDIDELPAVIDAEDALADGAPLLFDSRADNLAVTESPDAPLDLESMSDVVVRGRYVNQRLAVAPMETHGFAAAPGPDGSLTIWASNQMPHYTHGQVAGVLGVDPSTVHLISPQVGGGFGGKAAIQHEYTSVAAAAQRLGRPVVWVPTRTEDMQA